jgi:hypothetical protein
LPWPERAHQTPVLQRLALREPRPANGSALARWMRDRQLSAPPREQLRNAVPEPPPLGIPRVIRGAHPHERATDRNVLDVIAPNIVVGVLVFAAGGLLVLGLVAGLYVLAAAAVIALVGAVVSAWLLLVRVVE